MEYDCGFTQENKWFRYRAAAIIVEDGYVLFAGNEKDDYYYSIGGGVHMGETAEDAVKREVLEETGVEYEVDRLAVIHENFFGDNKGALKGMDCHEIAFYFLMKPRGTRELKGNSFTQGVRENMQWLPIDKLDEYRAFPTFMKEYLQAEHAGIEHIVSDERTGSCDASQNDFGKKVIEKALLYAEHEWCPSEKNVMHGVDVAGRFVDTPDVTWRGEELNCGWWKPGQVNVGVPYGWGNASSLEDFDRGIAEGKYAGNVPEDTSRYGSHNCVGVDCSGLLTVCWDLPKKIVARDIPTIADVIDVKDLRQGDVLAISSHVMLFKEFLDDKKRNVRIIDSTRSTGKVSQRDFLLEDLLSQGYLAYRKR